MTNMMRTRRKKKSKKVNDSILPRAFRCSWPSSTELGIIRANRYRKIAESWHYLLLKRGTRYVAKKDGIN